MYLMQILSTNEILRTFYALKRAIKLPQPKKTITAMFRCTCTLFVMPNFQRIETNGSNVSFCVCDIVLSKTTKAIDLKCITQYAEILEEWKQLSYFSVFN